MAARRRLTARRRAIWVTGTYDPELNLVYYGTGNPGPDYYSERREGDNLYTARSSRSTPTPASCSWHYQFTPHDVHDWDSTQVPVLADLTIGGQPRKVVMFANRNGFFYTLDRVTGKVLVAKPFVETTWAKEIGADGRPVLLPGTSAGRRRREDLPRSRGGTNFMPPSYDPTTRLFFVTARETCATYYALRAGVQAGRAVHRRRARRGRAIRRTSARCARSIRRPASGSGSSATPTPSSPACCRPRPAWCSPATTTATSWRSTRAPARTSGTTSSDSSMRSTAGTTYMLDGRQYLLVPAGSALMAFALPQRP